MYVRAKFSSYLKFFHHSLRQETLLLTRIENGVKGCDRSRVRNEREEGSKSDYGPPLVIHKIDVTSFSKARPSWPIECPLFRGFTSL